MACLRRNNQNRFFKFRNSRISFCGYDGSYQRFPAVFAADAQHYSRRRDVKLEKLRAQTHCANRAELLFCRAAAFLCLRTSDRGICNNGGRLKGSFCPPDLYPNALGQHIYCNSAGCCAVDGCNRGLVLCSFSVRCRIHQRTAEQKPTEFHPRIRNLLHFCRF